MTDREKNVDDGRPTIRRRRLITHAAGLMAGLAGVATGGLGRFDGSDDDSARSEDLPPYTLVAATSGQDRDLLSRVPQNLAGVYTLSSQPVTATCSLASATTSISGGVLRRPKLQSGSSTDVDLEGDTAFRYLGTPSLAYGTTYPNTNYVRTPLLTGGGRQAASWYGSARFYWDGQILELAFKCLVTASEKFRLKVDGRWVTCTAGSGTTLVGGGEQEHHLSQNSAGNLVTGSPYLLRFDFGSAAPRLVELEFQNGSFGGFYVEPTASITKGPKPVLTLATLGDSLTGGAGTSVRSENYTSRLADLLGCDGVYNLGIGGTGYLSATIGTDDFITRVPDVVAAAPDILVIWGGQNDQTHTATALQTAEETLLSTLLSAVPDTQIFLIGMWSPGNASATRVALNDALGAGAVNQGVPFIDLIDPRGQGRTAPVWTASTAYRNGDVVTTNTTPYVCVVAHTSTSSFDNAKWLGVGYVNGRIGTNLGNAGRMVQPDGIHQTSAANDLLERTFAGEIVRLLAAGIP